MPSDLLRALREHLGREVRVETVRGDEFRGTLVDVDPHFNLILSSPAEGKPSGPGSASAHPRAQTRVIRGDAVLYLVL